MVWSKQSLAVFLFMAVVGGSSVLCGAEDVKTPDTTKQLAGEWLLSNSQHAPENVVVIWTFKPNGIVRLDAINAKSREKVREGPMVGRWRAEGKDIICNWESWNDRQHRPAEAEERFRVRMVSKSELLLEIVSRRGKPVAEKESLHYKRFSGWE